MGRLSALGRSPHDWLRGARRRLRWLGWLAVGTLLLATRARPPAAQTPAAHRAAYPQAEAHLQGGPLASGLQGRVEFEAAPEGTLVRVEVSGLPAYRPGSPPIGPHGFHVHAVGDCTVGDPADPFLAAGPHFDPDGQPHGNHAGDFPVLFSQGQGGQARLTFLTGRLRPEQVVGRSVIVHENPDDFRTQPAGASGRRLACGVIQPVRPSR